MSSALLYADLSLLAAMLASLMPLLFDGPAYACRICSLLYGFLNAGLTSLCCPRYTSFSSSFHPRCSQLFWLYLLSALCSILASVMVLLRELLSTYRHCPHTLPPWHLLGSKPTLYAILSGYASALYRLDAILIDSSMAMLYIALALSPLLLAPPSALLEVILSFLLNALSSFCFHFFHLPQHCSGGNIQWSYCESSSSAYCHCSSMLLSPMVLQRELILDLQPRSCSLLQDFLFPSC